MNTIEIRKVTLTDLEHLQIISRQTFLEAFSKENTEENMKCYMAEAFNTDKLTTEITNAYSEFYFAMLNQEVIGYLKINLGQAQTELKDDKALEIERIYVLKEFYGKNVGQALFDKALEIALQAKADYLWLGVWAQNLKAVHFYKKNGLVEFDKHIFRMGNDEQTDIMMKLQIKNEGRFHQ